MMEASAKPIPNHATLTSYGSLLELAVVDPALWP
jgi:hypothetical protein